MVDPEVKFNKITLSYTGLFDFDGLYVAITDWAKNYGFLWHESDYKHKVPSSKGAEVEFKWLLSKNVNEYVNNEITITVHIWNMLEVEVDVNGQKRPYTNATLYFWLEPVVNFDWQGKAKSSKLAGILGKWYNKIMDREYAAYLDELYYRTLGLQAIIKTYFDMETKKNHYKRYLG